MPSLIPTDARTTKQLRRNVRLSGGWLDKESTSYFGLDEDPGFAQVLRDVDLTSSPGIIRPRAGHSLYQEEEFNINSLHLFKSQRLGDHLIYVRQDEDEGMAKIYYKNIETGDIDYIKLKHIVYNVLEMNPFYYASFDDYPLNTEIEEHWEFTGISHLPHPMTEAPLTPYGTLFASGSEVVDEETFPPPNMKQNLGIPFREGTKLFVRLDAWQIDMSTLGEYDETTTATVRLELWSDVDDTGPMLSYEIAEPLVAALDWSQVYHLFEIEETIPGNIVLAIGLGYDEAALFRHTFCVVTSNYRKFTDVDDADELNEHEELENWFEDKNETVYDLIHSFNTHRFANFADALVGVNGVDNSFVWDGEFAYEPEQFPKCTLIAEYRNRLAIAGIEDNPTLLALSHTGDPYLWNPFASGSNATELYVSPDDGEGVTGILNMGDGGLLVTKRNKLYGLFGYVRSNFTIELLESEIGCISHDSLEYISPFGYFLHDSGVYRVQTGAPAENISLQINRLFRQQIVVDSVGAFVYNRNYLLHFISTDGNPFMINFIPQIEQIVEWTVHEDTFGVVKSAVQGQFYDEFYFINVYNEIRKSDKSTISDRGGKVKPVIHTIPLAGGVEESLKDFDRLNLYAVSTGVRYKIKITTYIDEVASGHPVFLTIDAEPVGFNHVIETLPVGRTGRYMSVKFEYMPEIHNTSPFDFGLVGFSYLMNIKDVR